MKKVGLILGFVFSVVLFTSCTDNTEENINENEIQSGVEGTFINPNETGEPGDGDDGEG